LMIRKSKRHDRRLHAEALDWAFEEPREGVGRGTASDEIGVHLAIERDPDVL